MAKKLITVVGARPQFIKAAVVSRALQNGNFFEEMIVHTGQHYDHNMSQIFFSEMEIPSPAYNLGIQETLHGAMTGKMMAGLEEIFLQKKPALVMVYGDTNSTLAAALAAVKLHIPVAHVEAGLRSFNRDMPEEINRILTDKVSRFLFCPTEIAISHLQEEGFNTTFHTMENTGDVMLDAANYYFQKSSERAIEKYLKRDKKFILATIHRPENVFTVEKMHDIIFALNTLHKDIEVICPMHPGTKKLVDKYGFDIDFEVIQPVGYFDMLQLIHHSSLVITDSGGLQKEAYFFKKYCITLREETEWVELVENGFSFLSGSDKEKIIPMARIFLSKAFPVSFALYGDGHAGEKIARTLLAM
ncbi:MAG: UDP-N-acetylglucosamine 2-epimerase (non-hydrolyzing) [Bacteroidetes bacterium]|nr:UDP-N-acetylglucosamine 2-epimerase (non-hydrolyzing) [Bacteroidota bacterium]